MQLFNLEFIALFFLLFWVYWLLCNSKKAQNILLLLASYAFYAYYDWRCCGLLFAISVVAYCAGLYFKRIPETNKTFLTKNSKWWVSCGSIIFCLGILGYFKYANFFLQSINDITGGGNFEPLSIILPIGVSFYTFSSISYIVDCYQGKVEPTKDIVAGLLYTSFFPAIMSGPIHKATEQLPQYLKKREFDYDTVAEGFRMYLWGVFMKLCVADKLGMYVDAVYGNLSNHNGTTFVMASVLYTLQIYADFAGYSNMAIGCGKMLGIRLQTNFLRPYFSKTITEFWSKWHMSLTSWFKNYVYFPLGGNRVSRAHWIANIMIVFLLSGLWHGAAYTFIIWGALHGIAQVIEKLIYGDKIKKITNIISIANALRVVLTFSIVSIAWIFFRVPSTQDAFQIIGGMFTSRGPLYMDPSVYIGFLSLLILIMKDFKDEFGIKIRLLSSKSFYVRHLTYILLVAYIILFGSLGAGQFIYFQF